MIFYKLKASSQKFSIYTAGLFCCCCYYSHYDYYQLLLLLLWQCHHWQSV